MTCQHTKGDPNCSSTVGGTAWHALQDAYARNAAEAERRKAAETPDAEKFNLLGHHEALGMLALRVE